MTGSTNDSAALAKLADAFGKCRHGYLHITSQAPNRLTISTFLAGLNFAAFAALLALPNIAADRRPTHEHLFLLVSSSLLGFATVLFLVAAISTYVALQRVGDVAPSTVHHLQDVHPVDLDRRDQHRILLADEIYTKTSNLIPAGLGFMLLALPFVGAHLNLEVGALVLLFLAGAALTFLRRIAWSAVKAAVKDVTRL